MSQEDRLIEEYESLKAAPDLSKWLTELERILLGEREYAIVRLGSVEQYIKLVLDESSDWAKARATFKQALSHTVQMWQGTETEWGNNTSYLLDLIAAYTPPRGENKLLDYLRALKRFDFPGMTNAKKDELRLKTLITLEHYFHLAPILYETEPAYMGYRQMLGDAASNDPSPVIRMYAEERMKEIESVEIKVMAYETKERAEEVIESVGRVAKTWS